MSILNCTRSGKLLPDRSIREYCRDIWHAEPVRCELLSPDVSGFLNPRDFG